MLKLKSTLHRYTGIYLAHSELDEYLARPEVQQRIQTMQLFGDEPIDPELNKIILRKLWEADHGFTRPLSFLYFKRPRKFWAVIAWFVDFGTVLKWDLQRLIRKLKCQK